MAATVREQLLREGLRFVRAAVLIPGVRGIALVGSITTPKPRPKDIDFLVTVEDDADLAVLATCSRRLRGRLQGLSLGADVFLADMHRQYLGRLCSWRDCRPGIRLSCDAMHCGRRAHLHDDLSTVRLSPELVATPPLVIWPTVVRQGPMPSDLEAWVLAVSHAVCHGLEETVVSAGVRQL